MIAIGLMSGTSLDGVDAALVNIDKEEKFSLLKFVTLPYTKEFKERSMRNLNDETAKLSEICSLNFELGYWFVEAIDLLLKDTQYSYSDIDFVASHGQTIWHNPHDIKFDDNYLVASTLQIGETSVISTKTGIKTISDFRSADIVAGGEGAPLVPMSEFILFRSENSSVILQNIGGISNLTYLKKGCSIDEVIAFDCGPGNIMIDYFMNKLYDLPFDEEGKVASSGMIINSLFEELISDEFIQLDPPKSTGREKYSKEYMEYLYDKFDLSKVDKEDIITTITEYTVYCISYCYRTFIKDFDRVIISGGGSHNKYILERLSEDLDIKVVTQDDIGYSSDAKEAVAFTVLGYLSLNGKTGNVKSATGAKIDVVLGTITLTKTS